ncbi:MAG: Protein ArsC [Methanosaeta sp. PtaB.Bin039]|nr:MAG: Protein ArsC [Methanosaeta sp. PtaB.Bin039]OPY44422.1 MAG: Protein ArsC [Methanosaeta sp. PtaU1.Bin028]
MADAGPPKKKVLFLCTHNSARSQMAEGLLRAMYGDRFDSFSAGTVATSVNWRAVEVMGELGIDISHQRSKTSEDLFDIVFDLAVTLCDGARQACPVCSTNIQLPSRFPRAREVIHRGFEDPDAAAGSEEEKLQVFRQVRDQIKEWISRTFGG